MLVYRNEAPSLILHCRKFYQPSTKQKHPKQSCPKQKSTLCKCESKTRGWASTSDLRTLSASEGRHICQGRMSPRDCGESFPSALYRVSLVGWLASDWRFSCLSFTPRYITTNEHDPLFFYLVCYFETGSFFVNLVGLAVEMQTRLTLNSDTTGSAS